MQKMQKSEGLLINKESSRSPIQMGIHAKLFCLDKAWGKGVIMEDDEEEDDQIPDWT